MRNIDMVNPICRGIKLIALTLMSKGCQTTLCNWSHTPEKCRIAHAISGKHPHNAGPLRSHDANASGYKMLFPQSQCT